MKTNRQQVTGFSLTEILVALVISSILMYGVVSIMTSSKRTYALQNELAKLQDNARFIMEDMTFNLRMAGFRGCAGMNETVSAIFGNKNLISGENNLTIEDVSGYKVSETFPKTDSLEVRFLGAPLEWYDHEQYSPPELKPGARAYLSASSLWPGDRSTVLVSDCEKMQKVEVDGRGQEEGVNEEAPSGTRYIILKGNLHFKRPIDIFPMPGGRPSGVLYEVRADPVSGFVLYRNDPDQPKYEEPFVEGVENLQVRYGLDRAGGITYSDTPPKATDNVKSVKITLLMRTPQRRFDIKDTTEKKFYLDPALDSEFYNPTENLAFEKGYRHRLFTSVISIRNANFNK